MLEKGSNRGVPPLDEEACWQFIDYIFDETPVDAIIINHLRGDFDAWARALNAASEDSHILEPEQQHRLAALRALYERVNGWRRPRI